MYTNISKCGFHDAFRRAGRKDNFSYEGLNVLFDYLEALEDESGEPIELDVVEFCCEWTECTIVEALESYGLETLEDLCDETLVLKVDDETIIYLAY